MKAITYTNYGSPNELKLQEVEKPIPKENEVLIKVHAVSINFADWALLTGKPFLIRLMTGGFWSPKYNILGGDVAGVVEGVGVQVSEFQQGDQVFGDLSDCGLGGLAEFVCAREDMIVHKPTNLSFEEASAMPLASITALQAFQNNKEIKPNQKVLIVGASGGVGTFVLQMAKYYNADVTAVCGTGSIEMTYSLGADQVIDYNKEDFTKQDQHYDFIFAVNGYHSIFQYRRALHPKGIYIMMGGTLSQIFQGLLLTPIISIFGNKKMRILSAKSNKNDLIFIKELIENGKLFPVIDRQYSLSEIEKAFTHFGKRHTKGKIIITNYNS